ncbi:putative DNA-binding transcriptional regulator YafY [Flavobacterium nitrogenifigens]|uniref:DNA-binding transcriptional regulator YafY n=2 Tax=Flavobacterium TaxID=237 RepID=A0ABR6QJ42_9FLAO|nr:MULTISPECIES: WYL domain-containing protein [Flavobacterium]MBB4804392.1 putative DNA-binding transcriptional regulator YafY [Flavobacterium nitrogenifigens]MBB6389212.1 putative DNA-binding transcriptional regulator YafY [Flavobacterium notoginsengisoli]
MSKLIYFKRYLYIIDRLRSHNCDFKDLQRLIIRKLENEDIDTNFEYSVRTFERDKKDILDIFGIVINYNRKDKTYSIDEEEIEDQSVTRIMDAFSIHQALQEGNKLSPSVFLEKRKSSGTENIHGIIHAIQNLYIIKFTHQKHWEDFNTNREVYPIAIKESHQRWYLIALDKKDEKIKTFGLDRISNLNVTDTNFKPIRYNVEKEFQHAFGVETYSPAEKVVLEFVNKQGNYIKTFPLHESQKIIKENEDTLLLEIYIHTTNDIVMELMKYGADVKVISPARLQNEIKNRISKMANLYI